MERYQGIRIALVKPSSLDPSGKGAARLRETTRPPLLGVGRGMGRYMWRNGLNSETLLGHSSLQEKEKTGKKENDRSIPKPTKNERTELAPRLLGGLKTDAGLRPFLPGRSLFLPSNPMAQLGPEEGVEPHEAAVDGLEPPGPGVWSKPRVKVGVENDGPGGGQGGGSVLRWDWGFGVENGTVNQKHRNATTAQWTPATWHSFGGKITMQQKKNRFTKGQRANL